MVEEKNKKNGHVTPRSEQIILKLTGVAGVVFGAQIDVDFAAKIMQVRGVSGKFTG